MERIELIEKLFDMKRETSELHMDYLTSPRDYLEGDELYMREAHLVMEVDEENPPKMSDLAEKLNVTQGAISQMVGRLEEKGYLYRKQDMKDKRSNLVHLTEKGKRLKENHREYDEKAYEDISKRLKAFNNDDLKKFIEYEEKILEIFK